MCVCPSMFDKLMPTQIFTHKHTPRERERGKDFGIHTLKFVMDVCMVSIFNVAQDEKQTKERKNISFN